MITSSLICLATVMYFEARGDGNTEAERREAMLAVGDVVMERVEREDRTPCEITQAAGQFAYQDPRYARLVHTEWASAVYVASAMVFDGERLGLNATHFHAVGVTPYWTKNADFVGRIGDHLFWEIR